MPKVNANHFEPIDESYLEEGADNQFLLSAGRLGNSSQDQLIRKLEAKNLKLMNQIKRIDNVIHAPPPKVQYGVKIPESKAATTTQQLSNAYKRIKSYEYEIKKIRELKDQGTFVQQIKKMEVLLKEKEDLSAKLRKQLGEVQKQSNQLIKLLKNDQRKEYYDKKAQNLNTQINFLRQKIKQFQAKKGIHSSNFQKQGLFVKKLQRELMAQGMDQREIQQIRMKIFAQQKKQSTYYDTAYGKRKEEDEDDVKGFVEDRTPQAFKYLMNQIKLLQKIQKDYKGQLKVLEIETEQASNVNLKSRNKLLQIQDEIQKVEQRANELKKQIDPRNLKPQRALSTMQMRGKQGVGRYGNVNKSLSSIKSPFKPLYKTQQTGNISTNGKRFTDRIKLGKVSSKIVGVDFYENKMGLKNIVGIQTSYNVNGTIKKSVVNMIHDPKMAEKTSIMLENGDFFREIQLVLDDNSIIVGIKLTSGKGVSFKGGSTEGTRRPLNIASHQYPACFFGSFCPEGIQLFGSEIIEQSND